MSGYTAIHEKRKSLLSIALISFIGAFILILQITGTIDLRLTPHAFGYSFEIAVITLGLALVLLIVWRARSRGKFDLLELPVWISINVYLQAVLPLWLLKRDAVVVVPWLQADPGPKMTEAIILFGVGLLFLWFGFIWALRQKERKPNQVDAGSRQANLNVMIVIWIMSQLATIFQITLGGEGFLGTGQVRLWTNYFAFLQILGWAAWAGLVIYHFRQPTDKGWAWLILSLALDIGIGLIVGTKRPILTFIWLILLSFYVNGTLFNKRWLVVASLAVLFLVPTVNLTRQALLETSTIEQGVAFSERLPILADTVPKVLDQPVSSLYADTTETFANRQTSLTIVTASVLYVHPEQQSYVGLQMLKETALGLIPRIIWSGKPVGHSQLYDITGTYIVNALSLAEIGLFGDAYRAGGWLFVVFCFSFIGVLGAWFYERGPGKKDDAGMVYYYLLLAFVITYDISLATLVVRFLTMGSLLWILVMYVMYLPEKRIKKVYLTSVIGPQKLPEQTK